MIVVKLEGGIGNQLFQYAAGRNLSYSNKTKLKFDVSSFKSDNQRDYALEKFNIIGEIATDQEIEKLTMPDPGIVKRVIHKTFRLPPRSTTTHIKEKNYNFDPDILKLSDQVYLEGYWQSEKYFAPVSDLIRTELEPKHDFSHEARTMAETIASSESVSLHIRRGDYVSDSVVARKHGTCSLEYYQECVKTIASRVSNPVFFLFSDDLEWVESNFTMEFPRIIVDCNGSEMPEGDLMLMSHCKHNIIANSSFSWWGAWLNPNPQKTVMAPHRWLNIERNTNDLFPKDWIIIKGT
jgi:glycosyl transferase family 11